MGAASFDHLIGTGEDDLWYCNAKGLRGLEVEDQFEGSRLLDREVRWLGAF